MTQDEFKELWLRESGTQPGIMLEVLSTNGINITKRPTTSDQAA